jgi:hypothetical protein
MSDKWIQDRIKTALGKDAYKQYVKDKILYPDCEKDILVNVGSDYITKASELINGSKIKN